VFARWSAVSCVSPAKQDKSDTFVPSRKSSERSVNSAISGGSEVRA